MKEQPEETWSGSGPTNTGSNREKDVNGVADTWHRHRRGIG